VQSFGSTKGRHDENIVVVNEVLKTWKKKWCYGICEAPSIQVHESTLCFILQ